MSKVVLGSTSPRRKELLRGILGSNFQVSPSDYEEDNARGVDTGELVKEHALGKAKDVAGNVSYGVVIGADNLVVLEGEVLGKPKDAEDAKRMLRTISGKLVEVLGGIALVNSDTGKETVHCERTKVKIKELSEEEINKYVETGEPLDKAGAFAAQGVGSVFVEGVEGCYYNVVGLSLYRLNLMLEEHGISLLE